MLQTLLKIAFSVAVVIGCTKLFWFVEVEDVQAAILFVAVIGLLNIFFKPLLTVLTIPVTVFTFGFFLLVINTIIIRMADYFIDGFFIETFWHTFLFSLVYSLSNTVFESFFFKNKNQAR